MNLYSCDIPRNFANAIIGLFGDSAAITKEQERLFGPQVSQQNAQKEKDTTNKEDKAAQQNNDLTNNIERNEQEQ